ncbi:MULTISPECIES: lipid-A-disaccharide synthase [unclassified Mucilaginibacter]|uniref:lipid-A-disaccharide synthase n=1 Tax=unclassified Mucilaginibacter TaxID=2617802 RepID=UPI002AC9CA6F|nr:MULTISPECIES: lipid-A-disaccharide synthase [unclassified Mucilaginibacter]MEB0263377.1 lipid-A-disaccharide synthase [Mucilaginibacter sp. 10I4]MEB0279306.1 lipid-A-disaccharide synthase [Mucilaginibacter sp. 10B2]MEB0302910.1 lipid-A-disaccharide synthase [Mucilaginibacter sp. 5C4]WPX23182.1 lipid-A-disaccharide synthase [Mucilaginibacter sp. 5C4]
MKYYLVAGEASGDLHGANLMKALKELDEQADFRFFGGDLMKTEGGTLVKHYADMAFMGFVEVVINLNTILKNLKKCKADIMAYKPDVLVLIDFPGFNLKIAEFAKAQGIEVYYYISPKVWAWNQKRVLKIKKVVDHMFCILPFEVEFYKSWGMEIDYVGNPLLDAVDAFKPNPNFIVDNNLTGKKIVALLPGSRKQEISRLLSEMLGALEKFPHHQFVVAGAPSFNAEYYKQYLGDKNIPVIFNATYDILANAEAAVVASGTATLEAALFNVPQVVVYRGNALTIGIARMLIKIKFISLVNLIMDKLVVAELIQKDCTSLNITEELNNLLHNAHHRQQMLADYDVLDERMGAPGASAKTAKLIVKYAQNNKALLK